jgi:hypothetical protein
MTAMKYLCIQASSASSERVFKWGSNNLTKHRRRLSERNLHNAMIVSSAPHRFFVGKNKQYPGRTFKLVDNVAKKTSAVHLATLYRDYRHIAGSLPEILKVSSPLASERTTTSQNEGRNLPDEADQIESLDFEEDIANDELRDEQYENHFPYDISTTLTLDDILDAEEMPLYENRTYKKTSSTERVCIFQLNSNNIHYLVISLAQELHNNYLLIRYEKLKSVHLSKNCVK